MSEIEIVPSVEDSEIMNEVTIPREDSKRGYWGIQEGVAPSIDDGKLSGQVKSGDMVIAQFENGSQAIVSLFYSRFAINQILAVVPCVAGMGEVKLGSLLNNRGSRKLRYEFIKPLVNYPARKLYESEYLAIVAAVGNPAGKPKKSTNVIAIRAMINADIENIELLKPKVRTARVVDPEKIKNQIEILTAKLVVKQNKVNAAKTVIENMTAKFAGKPTDSLASAIRLKESKLSYDSLMVSKLEAQIVKLQNKISA